MDKSRVLLSDIALEAGVSKSTVSLALRGVARIPSETRTRIQAIAERLGYTPDPVLLALNTYRRKREQPRFVATVAFLNELSESISVTSWGYVRDYFQGATERGRSLGFRIEEHWLRAPGMSPRALDRMLQARGISCVLVGPLSTPHGKLDIDWTSYASVALGHSLESPPVHRVSNNHFASMRTCVENLHSLGYRRIGLYLHRSQDERVMGRWSGAFLSTLERLEHPFPASRVRIYDVFDPGEFRAWWRREKPDALVTGTPGLEPLLQEQGVRIPEDVGFALPYESSSPEHARIAHIQENGRLVGATAMDFVAGMYFRNERGLPATPVELNVPGIWTPGTTVKPRR
jgi:DNA-binding LacI/PurR family transcriptional regulator